MGCDAVVATLRGFERTGKGEIVLLGAQIAAHYLPLDHPNNEKFGEIDGQRYFYTGDLGEIDSLGRLKIFGRSDSQVKINGHRVELGEIERQAMKMHGVKLAVALCPASDRRSRDLILVVTPNGAEAICQDGVRQHLKEALPAFMVPSQVIIEASLPLSVAGKIDRKVINARLGFN
jgi:acyl-coenzyme A synthetase/AMP-(fatty) acid ligase